MKNNLCVKDSGTLAHCQRTYYFSKILAELCGCSKEQVAAIATSSTVHDIGKRFIPRRILLKPAKLTTSEFKIIKMHVLIGVAMIGKEKKIARTIILDHHERWDGGGYPFRKKKEEISLGGRVVMLADVFDALTSERPYKKAYAPEVAIDIMKNDHGHFDPHLFGLFWENKEKFIFLARKTGRA